MNRARAPIGLAAVMSAVLFASAPATSVAVVGAQPDLSNDHANVAGIEFDFAGDWYVSCTGTLIASDIVLTAAHCVDGWPSEAVRANFNPAISLPADPADPLAYGVAEITIHPQWAPYGPGGGNSKTILGPGFEDLALLTLSSPVVGITPASVAGAGYLDALDLQAASFTAVGYGLNGYDQGAFVDFLYRSFRSDVRALGEDAYRDRFLKISAANCFGDSGGPLFHGSTIVAVTVWTNNGQRCAAPGLDYRLDSAIAKEFLEANL